MAGAVKKVLNILYGKVLRTLQKMPEDSVYRKSTEQIINHRLGVVNSEKNVQKIEEVIGGGQIEELILQAENELHLARKMLAWKPWEPLVREAPPKQWVWPV
uniref:NADH dehydrogenase (Ubiquinone) 1 alpha subcomplex subunit 5 n=1 Tax=Scolopendra viridis TaxID=118503 RepID=A0A4D5RAJ1_SCOVI